MCGRFTLSASIKPILEYFDISAIEIFPRYNIAPSQNILGIQQVEDHYALYEMRWGLIPSWAQKEDFSSKYINARAETIESIPLFKKAFLSQRCLVLANGFYEWKNVKQPYYMQLKDKGVFAMAGIWERWEHENEMPLMSCALIVTNANAPLRVIHDRMPMIIQPKDYQLWLNNDIHDVQILNRLLEFTLSVEMIAYPVSRKVNNSRYDAPDCIVHSDQA